MDSKTFLLVYSLYLVIVVLDGQVTTRPTDFCSGDSLPEFNFTCTSCLNKCGEMMDFKQKMFCSCDSSCILYNECCSDFRNSCPHIYNKAVNTAEIFKGVNFNCLKYDDYYNPTSLVVSCPLHNLSCERTSPFDNIPVTDMNTGVEFINAKCAACNGVKNGKVWGTTLYCNENETIQNNIKATNNQSELISTENVLKALADRECELRVELQLKQFHKIRDCLQYYSNPCEQSSCRNEALKNECKYGSTHVVSIDAWKRSNFRNIHCAMCLPPDEFRFVQCGDAPALPAPGGKFPEFSLAVIFDFNPHADNGVGIRSDPDSCTVGQEWIDEITGCKDIICGPDFKFNGNMCVLEWSTIHISVTAAVIFCNNFTDGSKEVFPDYISSKISDILEEYKRQSSDYIEVKYKETLYVVLTDGNSYKVILSIYIKLNSFEIEDTAIQNETNKISHSILQNLYFHAVNWFMNSTQVRSLEVFGNNNSQTYKYSNLNCLHILLKEDEYQLLSNGSIIVSNSIILTEGNYLKNGTSVFVCKHIIQSNSTTRSSGINTLNGIITITFMTLSEIGILVRLVLQPILPVYSSFPLKLQFNMCLAMFLTFGIFLISPLFMEEFVACKIVAILLHWGFLSLFCWITVISIDTWDSFRGFGMKKRSRNTGVKILCRYILVGWGIPLFWVIAGIIVDELNVNSVFQPEYGLRRCWMNQSFAILIFFAFPFGISMVLNITFYSLTAFNLRKTFHESNTLINKEKERHFGLYVKLFILMGITWTIGFIAPFVDHIAMWIIFLLLNASQGIFIFIAFVCTKQVFSALLKLKGEHSQETSESNRHHHKSKTETALTILPDYKFDDLNLKTQN